MALSGEQWLQSHFFPVVESLSVEDGSDPESRTAVLKVMATMRLQGAVDALRDVGALDEEQQERCRAALESKGVTSKRFEVRSFGVMTGHIASGMVEVQDEPVEEEPDRLVRVVAGGQVFGLVDDEQAVLTCVEVWRRSVRASLLLAVSAEAERAREERGRVVREWLTKKQAGEIPEGERPPMSNLLGHPGASTTWLLAGEGSSTEGRVVSGQGGSEWWRVSVEWPVTLSPDCHEVELSATEDGRVVGRTAISW